MKQEYKFQFRDSSNDLVDRYLKNNDYETLIHSTAESRLLEWLPSDQTITCSYTVFPKWSNIISGIVLSEEIHVREKRIFEVENNCYKVTSELKTQDVDYLSGTIKRFIQDNEKGCFLHLTIEIKCKSSSVGKQLAAEFFSAMMSHIFPINHTDNLPKEVEGASAGGLQVPSRITSDFVSMHTQLQDIKDSSYEYRNVLDQAKLQRVSLPNIQISEIEEVNHLFDPKIYSISNDIKSMREEAAKTKGIIGELKKSREKVSNKGSLPLFMLATCAAVIYIFISNT